MRIFLSAPNPNPYLYDLLAAYAADVSVYTDRIRFNRKNRAHRIRIGGLWQAIPLKDETKHFPINQIRLEVVGKFLFEWNQKLAQEYGNQRYYHFFIDEIMAETEMMLSEKSSLSEFSHSLRRYLLDLIQWPYPKEKDWYTLTAENDSNTLDPALVLAKTAPYDQISIIHEWKSKPFQRQSSKAIILHTNCLEDIEFKLGLTRNDTLLDLLFKHGPYWFEYFDQNKLDFFS